MPFKQPCKYDINIKPVVNGGFILKVGCATLVYATGQALAAALKKYFDNPEKWEKEYNKHSQGQPTQPTTEAPPPGRAVEAGRAARS